MSRWMLSALRDESSLWDLTWAAAHVTSRRKHDSWILSRLFVNQRPDSDLAEYQSGLRRPGLSIILPRQPGAASLMRQLNAAHSRAHSRHYLGCGGLVYTWIFIAIGSIKIAGERIKRQIKRGTSLECLEKRFSTSMCFYRVTVQFITFTFAAMILSPYFITENT